MNLLHTLKSDMLELIDLSSKIAEHNQAIMFHSDINDKRNYYPNRVEKMKIVKNELQERFFSLKEKWF